MSDAKVSCHFKQANKTKQNKKNADGADLFVRIPNLSIGTSMVVPASVPAGCF